MWQTIVIASLVAAACIAVAIRGIVNKKKGKTSCSCGCNCGACGMNCHRIQEK